MSATGVHIDRDEGFGPESNPRADLCQSTVLEQQDIQFLVHVYLRRLNLAVYRLGEGDAHGGGREAYRRIARSVADEIGALDHRLEDFRTGPLIRLVLQGPRGAIFANSVLLDEYVMATMRLDAGSAVRDGILPKLGSVPHVDKAISTLVDRIRGLVGQPSLNPGGWFDNPPPAVHPRAVPPDLIHEEVMDPEGDRVLESFRKAVGRGALQYAALFRGADQLLEVDAFESNAIKQFLTRMAPQNRRARYRDFGRGAEALVAELARLSAPVTGAPLLRVVFDVEQGGILYYRVGDDRHLIAMTLDQSAVAAADEEAATLVLQCQ